MLLSQVATDRMKQLMEMGAGNKDDKDRSRSMNVRKK